ncbi:MAG: HAMP domain-containing histidine kinase [Spirochaetales bacterium]|nr:HAMP domain-containing histidine kinase [Spirochaetales bacterium]
MTEVFDWIRIAAVTLFSAELGIVIFRSRRFVNKREAFLFSSILLLLCLKLIVPELQTFQYISTFLLIIILSQLLFMTIPSKRRSLYTFSSLAGLLVLISLIPAGLFTTPLFGFFFILQCGFFAAVCLFYFLQFLRLIRKKLLLTIFLIVIVMLGAGGAEQLVHLQFGMTGNFSLVLYLLLGIAIAFLVFEEGYFSRTGFEGLFHRLQEEENRAREAFFKLSETEAHLAAQNRFVSMGVLSAGLTHEFKNMLGLVKSLTDYGIAADSFLEKEECLKQIKENTDISMTTVIGILDMIRSSAARKETETEIFSFLQKYIRLLKANYRKTGINISLVEGRKYSVLIKKNDLEQILLIIIRNAAEALRKKNTLEEKKISVRSDISGVNGIIEIFDNAGGVPEETALFLFDQHTASGESTGVGLYLAKLLAEQNNASIMYEHCDNESRFCITFPEIAELR